MPALNAAELLNEQDLQRVREAVRQAELHTSGELRVHLDDAIAEHVLDHAAFVFEELGMFRTRERNGVLIYVSVADRRMAVIGDAGINAVVPPGFWDGVLNELRSAFGAGRYADGLCAAVQAVGAKLAAHFPPRADDRNELLNDVSIG
ncbi:MAG: TPM domain-containing protein [Flavobacteriales bacterium]|nr:TPM domain-containing protein [Flavobacteriales bacterium]